MRKEEILEPKIIELVKSFKIQSKDDIIVVRIHTQEYHKFAEYIKTTFPDNIIIVLSKNTDIEVLPEKEMNRLGWFKIEQNEIRARKELHRAIANHYTFLESFRDIPLTDKECRKLAIEYPYSFEELRKMFPLVEDNRIPK